MNIKDLILQRGAQNVLDEIHNLCSNDNEIITKDQYAYWHGFWTKHSLTPMHAELTIVTHGEVDDYGKNYRIVQSKKFTNYYCRIDSYENSYGEITYHRWAVVKPIEKTIMTFE